MTEFSQASCLHPQDLSLHIDSTAESLVRGQRESKRESSNPFFEFKTLFCSFFYFISEAFNVNWFWEEIGESNNNRK